jgi:hypothetical protein
MFSAQTCCWISGELGLHPGRRPPTAGLRSADSAADEPANGYGTIRQSADWRRDKVWIISRAATEKLAVANLAPWILTSLQVASLELGFG